MSTKGYMTPPGALQKRYVRTPARRLSPKQSAKLIAAREKQKQALELKKAGATYEEIAKLLGYKNHSGAQYACNAAIDRLGLEAARDVVLLDLARLDEYQKRCTQELRSKNDLSQIDRLLRIMGVRHNLLGVTTDTFREEQAKNANVSITQNAVMVVQGTESQFVEQMMKAVGMNTDDPAVQKHLASLDMGNLPPEKTEVVRLALPPGEGGQAPTVVEVKRKKKIIRRKKADTLEGVLAEADAVIASSPAAPSEGRKAKRVIKKSRTVESAESTDLSSVHTGRGEGVPEVEQKAWGAQVRDVVHSIMAPPTDEDEGIVIAELVEEDI
jgi:hypothetical protein